MVTSVPSSYVPPVLDTPPPSAAVTERVYVLTQKGLGMFV